MCRVEIVYETPIRFRQVLPFYRYGLVTYAMTDIYIIYTLGDLAVRVRVRGRHFLFSSAYPAQLPKWQTATATTESNRKQHPRTLTARSSSMLI